MYIVKIKNAGDTQAGPAQVALHAPPLVTTATAHNTDEELLATHGKTFHFAARFLPLELRRSATILYAFFRVLDDLVDEPVPGRQCADIRAELEAWQHWFIENCTLPAPREPLGSSLAAVLGEHPVPTTIFLDFIDGLISDLGPREIRTFAEMHQYCYRVAGTVGLAMASMLGVRSASALVTAKNLGIAMQMTNILRDVGGDLALNRVYLPLDELESFGSSRTHLLTLYERQQQPDERFRALMRYQVSRTHHYYAHGMHGIWLLPTNCRLPILIAGRLYKRILTAIERNQYDVLRARASTTLPEKVYEAAIALLLDRLWRRGETWTTSEMEVLFGDEVSPAATHSSSVYTGYSSR